jgi:hypothetical protein
MNTDKNRQRATRYRKLALAEPDCAKADLLNKIADEAERGSLCLAEQPHPVSAMPVHRPTV